MKHAIPEPNDLPVMSQTQLDEALDKHARYMRGQKHGARLVLQYRNLSNLNFYGSDISQADFTASMLLDSNLSNCNCQSTSFFACDMRNANLRNANLTRADFRGAYVAGADLTDADMTGADMREGKIMLRDKDGLLEDRKRSGGEGAITIFKGAKLTNTKMTSTRAKHADFSDADLTGVSFRNADLSSAVMNGANLVDADLNGTNLTDTLMHKSIISGTLFANNERRGLDLSEVITEDDMGSNLANLGKSLPELLEEHTLWVATEGVAGRQLDLSGYDLRDVVDLRKFPLTAVDAIGANFLNQDLRGAELQSGNFDRADFRGCNMLDADLRGSTFKYAMMTRVNLADAQLCPLEFRNDDGTSWYKRVDLSGANLRFASLQGADLRDCILMGVDLSSANLKGCDLRRADLTGAILKGANLYGAKLDEAQIDITSL